MERGEGEGSRDREMKQSGEREGGEGGQGGSCWSLTSR